MKKYQLNFLAFTVFTLLTLLIFSFFAGCNKSKPDENIDEGRLFDETEIELSTESALLSIKKINMESMISSHLNLETKNYQFAYTNAQLSKFDPIKNDLSRLISAHNLMEHDNPYGKYGTGPRLIYDVDEDSYIYILQSEIIENNGRPSMNGEKAIFMYDEDGVELKSIPIRETRHVQNLSPKKLIAHNQQFIIVSTTGIQIIDANGNISDEISVPAAKAYDLISGEERVFPSGLIVDIDIVEENHIVLLQTDQNNQMITLYDIKNKQTIWSYELEHGFIPRKIHFEQETNEIYVTSNHYVLSYSKEGVNKGVFINFNEYQSGEFNSSLFNGRDVLDPGFIVFESPHMMYFYMVSTGFESNIQKIYNYKELLGNEKNERYKLMAKEQAKKTTLHLFLPYVNFSLEEIISQYERLNPNIRIVVSTFRDNHDEFNNDDYNQYISLQLLTNKTKWDILSTMHLSYNEYIEKGFFADLEHISPPFWEVEQERFLPNIIQASKVNGKLFLLPTRISLYTTLVDPKLAEQLQPFQYGWDNLVTEVNRLNKAYPEMKLWNFGSTNYQFNKVFDSVMDSFDTDILLSQDDPDLQKQLLMQFLDTMKMLSDSKDHIHQPGQPALFTMIRFQISTFLNYAHLLETENALLPVPASPQSENHGFVVQEGYAINNKSKMKEEALKLLLFLSQYTQPNNIILKQTYSNLMNQPGMTEQKKQAIQQMKTVIENLDSLRYLDYRLASALYATTQQYVEGLLEKEEAVRNIQDKLWLYTNE